MSTRSPPRPLPPPLSTGLRRLLGLVLFLFGLLAVNSLYLVTVSIAESLSGQTIQNSIYLVVFLAHLGVGLLLLVPAVLFGALHLRRARRRPNRYAVRAGVALYACIIALFASGVLLTRFGFFEVNDPTVRTGSYWIHVLMALAVIWLFILHRLSGPPLRWRAGVLWTCAALVLTAVGMAWHLGGRGAAMPLDRAFQPALVKTPAGDSIPPEHLMVDEACAQCHGDIAEQHERSMHRMSSFNNPAYGFSIDDTRAVLLRRDGEVKAARLCAACHDQVPLFSGRFDDPAYEPASDPGSQVGITCLGCHAVTAVNSPRGNGDYSMVDPPRYPFAFSDHPLLQAINRQLIKAKPAFHKATLLKPVHRDALFCSACHKVHLPQAFNRYRWLRGQNHYDSFLLSGVSGHRVDSFYYPPRAIGACADCHMPAVASDDPAARRLGTEGGRSVHDHRFAAANTAVPHMLGQGVAANQPRLDMLRRAARVDLFGLREGARVDGRLHAPLGSTRPPLQPGRRYVLEVVVRTLGVGHALTQGTADSNELWLDLQVRAGERLIGRSGALGAEGNVDPWAYFLNAYLLDRDGNRIDRRNAQDIYVALYDHQIPPGAAALVHYALAIPPDARGPIRVDVGLRYRKFDTRFYRHVMGDGFAGNDLPIATLARDSILLPLADGDIPAAAPKAIPDWERWNDYGIGLLRQGKRGESRQAEAAFSEVERLGSALGALNLARVLYREGRLDEAVAALQRAAQAQPPAPPWTITWYRALIARERGNLDAAIAGLQALAATDFAEARERGFDFSRDFRMLNELGRTLYERARQARGEDEHQRRSAFLQRARERLEQVLTIEPEYAAAHHSLGLVYTELDQPRQAQRHRALHQRYRLDENAAEHAVSRHRRLNPVADHAAEAVAVYDLQRPGVLAETSLRAGAQASVRGQP